MYGAILGDMIGAPYEFDRGNKTKDFPLFSRGSQFTDDSVMTIAVAEALMSLDGEADTVLVAANLSDSDVTFALPFEGEKTEYFSGKSFTGGSETVLGPWEYLVFAE